MTTITVTPDAASAAVLIEIADAPGAGSVLYGPEGFETDLDSWVAGNGDTTVYTAAGRGGGDALGVDWTSGGVSGIGWAQRVVGMGGFISGNTYRVGVWVHSADVTPHLARVQKVDGTPATGEWHTVGDEWEFITFDFVADASSHLLYLAVKNPSGTAAADVAWDDLEVELVPGELGTTQVVRSDANGTAPVRLREGQEPIDGVMVATDYEAALTGPLTYTVTDGLGGVAVASTTLAGVTSPWLSVPVLPQLGIRVAAVLDDYTSGYEARGVLHTVIDRPDRVPTLAPLSTRSGRFTVLCGSHQDAVTVAAVYNRGQVVHLRQPTHGGMDAYHVATGVDVSPDGPRWLVSVQWAEVARPTGPLLGGIGWDWATLSSQYTDWDEVRRSYQDWTQVTIDSPGVVDGGSGGAPAVPEPPAGVPPFPNTPTSNLITSGEADADTTTGSGVTVWETQLASLGYPVVVNGTLAAGEVQWVEDVQRRAGLPVTGQIDPDTWAAAWNLDPYVAPPAPDTTAPTVPSSVAAVAISTTEVTVTWGASTDTESGVAGYEVYRGGVLKTTRPAGATQWTETGLSPSTSYTYTVKAKDSAGNVSAASTGAVVSTGSVAPPPPAPTVPEWPAGAQYGRLMVGFAAPDAAGFPPNYEDALVQVCKPRPSWDAYGDLTSKIVERRIFKGGISLSTLNAMLNEVDARNQFGTISFKIPGSEHRAVANGQRDNLLLIIRNRMKEWRDAGGQPVVISIYHEPAGDAGVNLADWAAMQVYCSNYFAGWTTNTAGVKGTYTAANDLRSIMTWQSIMNGNKWGPNRVDTAAITTAHPQALIDTFADNGSILSADFYDPVPDSNDLSDYVAGSDRTSEKIKAFADWHDARGGRLYGIGEWSVTQYPEATKVWEFLRTRRDKFVYANYFNSGQNSKWEWRLIDGDYPVTNRWALGQYSPGGLREIGGSRGLNPFPTAPLHSTEELLKRFRTIVHEAASPTWTGEP